MEHIAFCLSVWNCTYGAGVGSGCVCRCRNGADLERRQTQAGFYQTAFPASFVPRSPFPCRPYTPRTSFEHNSQGPLSRKAPDALICTEASLHDSLTMGITIPSSQSRQRACDALVSVLSRSHSLQILARPASCEMAGLGSSSMASTVLSGSTVGVSSTSATWTISESAERSLQALLAMKADN